MLAGIRLLLGLDRVEATLPADPRAAVDLEAALRPTIPLDRALLCLDCESIFEALGPQRCPSCGSPIAWAMGRALNRPQ